MQDGGRCGEHRPAQLDGEHSGGLGLCRHCRLLCRRPRRWTLGKSEILSVVVFDIFQFPGYTVKKSFSIFTSSAGMSLNKLSLGGNNDVIYKLFPPRESLVSDISAGDGNIEKHFTV